MKPVREIVSRDIIDDLWGAGYTILPRNRHPDPFFVPQEMVPQGRFYQWWHLIHDKFHYAGHSNTGWAPVPASRHDGYFMPAGFVGDIEVNGLGLFEKAKFEVDAERAGNVAAAQKQVDDWQEKWGGQFSGEFSVGDSVTSMRDMSNPEMEITTVVGDTKTVENTTAIPKDMVPYIAQIFEERDYLTNLYATDTVSESPVWSTLLISDIATEMNDAMRRNPDAPKWPRLNAIVLPYAIANIRKRITEEATNGKTS